MRRLLFVFPLTAGATLLPLEAAWADPIAISQGVYDSYQEYLKTIGTNKPGAFAVSKSGDKSYYVHCTDENCYLSAVARQALEGCERDSKLPCTLLATNRDLKIEFTVFKDTSPISSDDAIVRHVLGADDLKAKVVGNTLRGEYPNHVKWSEYYDPSGEIRGTILAATAIGARH